MVIQKNDKIFLNIQFTLCHELWEKQVHVKQLQFALNYSWVLSVYSAFCIFQRSRKHFVSRKKQQNIWLSGTKARFFLEGHSPKKLQSPFNNRIEQLSYFSHLYCISQRSFCLGNFISMINCIMQHSYNVSKLRVGCIFRSPNIPIFYEV